MASSHTFVVVLALFFVLCSGGCGNRPSDEKSDGPRPAEPTNQPEARPQGDARPEGAPAPASNPPAASSAPKLLDVPLTLALAFDAQVRVPVPVIKFEDVKSIFDANCTRCHSPVARGGGFDVSAYPFVSVLREDETVEQLVARVLTRMKATMYMMPPGEPRPQDEIAQIEAWAKSEFGTDAGGTTAPGPSNKDAAALSVFYKAKGLKAEHRLDFAVDDQTKFVSAILPSLVSGQAYEFRFELKDGEGVVVQSNTRTLVARDDGRFGLDLACSCQVRKKQVRSRGSSSLKD